MESADERPDGEGSSQTGRARFSAMTLDEARGLVSDFASERDWDQFHSVRNILLALVGEVGELAECFQWKGDAVSDGLPEFEEKEKEHVGEELADVTLYLVRLSELCGIDLAKAVTDKMAKNRAKYPADRCRYRYKFPFERWSVASTMLSIFAADCMCVQHSLRSHTMNHRGSAKKYTHYQ